MIVYNEYCALNINTMIGRLIAENKNIRIHVWNEQCDRVSVQFTSKQIDPYLNWCKYLMMKDIIEPLVFDNYEEMAIWYMMNAGLDIAKIPCDNVGWLENYMTY